MNVYTNPAELVSATLTTDVPSISSSAMTVDLSIGYWAGNKLDRQASKEVTDANNAETGAARVNKSLLGNCRELVAIRKFVANARSVNYSMTMPWSNTGARLLPTVVMFKHKTTMTDLEQDFHRMVERFLVIYDWEVTKAQATLGDLFNRCEYPAQDTLRRRFHWEMTYCPLPDAGDFRIDVQNEALATMKSDYSAYYSTQLQGAMNDIWQRTHKVLVRMSKMLDYATKEDRQHTGFRDTLVSNALEIADLLDVCNVSHDPQMTAARFKLEDTLRGVTADALREDDYLRSETKRSVDEIISTLPSLDF